MWLIGRQPILDRDERIVAYELLFRSSQANRAEVVDGAAATASVILGALSGFGVRHVLGEKAGYLNVDRALLFSDSLELLPREQIVLELLETTELDDEVVRRCRELKARGFTLALDDHRYSPDLEDVYATIDLVKVDLMETADEALAAAVPDLRRHGVTLVAEKVETRQQYERCRELGFDRFQGYFFARPSTLRRKRIDESAGTLLRLLRLLMEDADVRDIEEAFRQSPGLTYKLLLLVNSVAIGTRQPIGTVRHAIAMLGRQQMKRWIQLALFGAHARHGLDDPLLEAAAVRATMMEQLCQRAPALSGGEMPAQAFMTGMLSLLDALYDVRMEELVDVLNLSGVVGGALVRRDGPLGGMLHLVERIEQVRLDEASDLLDALRLDRAQALDAQCAAFTWRDAAASAGAPRRNATTTTG